MATPLGREDPAVIEELRRTPQAFEFFQAVMLLEANARARVGGDAGAPLVGESTDPAADPVSFVAHPALGFPDSEVASVAEFEDRRPDLATAIIGLLGFSGALPQHYSELILQRLRENDHAARAFFGAITHRTISLFVRAWRKYRLAAQTFVASAESDTTDAQASIVGFIDAILGCATAGHRGRLAVPHDILRYYAGALAGNPASAAMLEAILSDYFGETIRVETFVARWETLPSSEQTRLTRNGYCRLGEEALIGARILRPDGAFRITIGPLSYLQFRAFLPDGRWLSELVHLVRLFTGETLHFDVQPVLAKAEVPHLRVGGGSDAASARLGWNTWLISFPPPADRDDAVLASTLVS